MLTTKVQRLLFVSGFFRLRDLEISAELVPGELCVPYWVGFWGRGARARFAVIDGVRRQVEGARVRGLLKTWLTAVREESRSA